MGKGGPFIIPFDAFNDTIPSGESLDIHIVLADLATEQSILHMSLAIDPRPLIR